MSFEEELSRVLNNNAKGFMALRSRFNHISLGIKTPKELYDEIENFMNSGVVCDEMCDPDLLMIIDPEFYVLHKKELSAARVAKPVFFAHLKLPKEIRFEGIRGAIYPVDIGGIHADFIEMDSLDYFNGEKNMPREKVAKYFFDNHPHKGAESYQKHLASVKELYVAMGIRTQKGYDVLKAARMK